MKHPFACILILALSSCTTGNHKKMAQLVKEKKLYADSVKTTSDYNKKIDPLVKEKNLFEDSLKIYNNLILDYEKVVLSVRNFDSLKRRPYENRYLYLLNCREQLQIRLVQLNIILKIPQKENN